MNISLNMNSPVVGPKNPGVSSYSEYKPKYEQPSVTKESGKQL